MKNKIRNSNLELLRIISMIMIIFHHYALHGFDIINSTNITFNKCLVDVLVLGGKIGVSIFILISGYFMINSKITIKKLWKLIGQVTFYSLLFLILFLTVLTPIKHIGIKTIIINIFPLIYGTYWFMTCYIILMILSPYLNKFIHGLEKNELKKLIYILVIIWCVISSIFGVIKISADMYCNNMIWFIILYMIASYIRLYCKFSKKDIKINKIVMYVSSLMIILSSIILNLLGKYTHIYGFARNSRYFSKLNTILVLIVSVSIFINFLNKKKYSNKFINELSLCSLGVYLIHDNSLFRPYLWSVIFKNSNYYESSYLFVHALVSIVIIYVVSSIIDYIRLKLIEPLWMKLYDVINKKYKIGELYE